MLRKAASDEPSKNIAVNLIRSGYPILTANDSDPFAASNRDGFFQVYDFARERGIRFAFQTRGGEGAIETIAKHPPTFVYVSINTDDPDRLRLQEPGAPSLEHRFELISSAKAAGHFVIVGINPLRMTWWRDLPGLIDRIHAMGVRHVWTGELHLNRFQRDNIPPARRRRFADDIDYAMSRVRSDDAALESIIDYMLASGLNVFREMVAEKSGFWSQFDQLGIPAMPTMDGLFDTLCKTSGSQPIAFSFDWFDRWANRIPDATSSAFKDYLMPFGRSIRNTGERPHAGSFRDVHGYFWRVSEWPTVLASRHFAIAVDGKSENAPTVADEDGRDYLVWSPSPHDAAYLDINDCNIVLE